MVAELLPGLHWPRGEESEAGDQTVRPDRNHDQVGVTGVVEISSYVAYHCNIKLQVDNSTSTLFSLLPVGSTIVLETRLVPEYSLTTMM